MSAVQVMELVESIIGPELGVYTDESSGESIPSIYVTPKNIPSNLTPSGLECIILQYPERDPIPMSGGQKYDPQTWSVYLLQRTETPWTLDAAVTKLLKKLTNASAFPVSPEYPILAQVAIRFTFRQVI